MTPATIRAAVLREARTPIVVEDVLLDPPRGVAPRGTGVLLPAHELLQEKGLKGSYYGSEDPAVAAGALAELAAAGHLDVTTLVSHVTDLEGIEAAFARLRLGVGARTVAIVDAELAGRAPAREAAVSA